SIRFFFNPPATTEIYTLSLHDALPIWKFYHRFQTKGALFGADDVLLELRSTFATRMLRSGFDVRTLQHWMGHRSLETTTRYALRSEEHTSELQSRRDLVCRLLLEKKKK